jgi:hypothetical protein
MERVRERESVARCHDVRPRKRDMYIRRHADRERDTVPSPGTVLRHAAQETCWFVVAIIDFACVVNYIIIWYHPDNANGSPARSKILDEYMMGIII